MTRPVPDLPKLTDFLLCILRSTDEAKSLLNSQCAEAKFVLTPWPLETITRRQLDEESCTCAKVASPEDHVNEIASGIDEAIAQARRLREKLASNVSEERRLARRPNTRQIYAPSDGGSKSESRSAGSKIGKENSSVDGVAGQPSGETERRDVMEHRHRVLGTCQKPCVTSTKKDSNLKKNPAAYIQPGDSNTTDAKKGEGSAGRAVSSERDEKSVAKIRRIRCNAAGIQEAKRIVDKKLIAASPYNHLAAASGADRKSKTEKNFIAANKSSIKNIKPARSVASATPSLSGETLGKSTHSAGSSAAMKSSESRISTVKSAVDIDKLIGRISVASVENRPLNVDVNFGANGCPVHDLNAPKYVVEKIRASVDVAEGINRFGISSDLVKVLKVYHSFANGRSTVRVTDKRCKKAAHKFLSEFQNMSRTEEKSSKRTGVKNLCKDFLSVFKESWNKNMDFVELSKLRIRYTDLDSSCKSLEIRVVSPLKRKVSDIVENRSDRNLFRRTGAWRLNAVWNEASIPNLQRLEGICDTRCIRYSKRNQLLGLFDLVQQIQRSKYHRNLVDLLIGEAVPWVQNTLERTSEDYVNAYRTISIISNPLHPSIPVLVKTDE